MSPVSGWGVPFTNPEILGEPLEEPFHNDDGENMRVDSCYTGRCDMLLTDEETAFDPEVIEKMVFEARATWLGKWFTNHYTTWVSEFDMKELVNYEINAEILRDTAVGPLPALCWSFRRFRVPEDECRSPVFVSPVRFL